MRVTNTTSDTQVVDTATSEYSNTHHINTYQRGFIQIYFLFITLFSSTNIRNIVWSTAYDTIAPSDYRDVLLDIDLQLYKKFYHGTTSSSQYHVYSDKMEYDTTTPYYW